MSRQTDLDRPRRSERNSGSSLADTETESVLTEEHAAGTNLDKIRDIDVESNTMTCEAGVVLQIAQQKAADVDRLFPLSLGAEGSCTIGGNLSTNAGGTGALAYGVAREMALGLEVVLADGRVLLPKEAQRRLGIRTLVAQATSQSRVIELNGHVKTCSACRPWPTACRAKTCRRPRRSWPRCAVAVRRWRR